MGGLHGSVCARGGGVFEGGGIPLAHLEGGIHTVVVVFVVVGGGSGIGANRTAVLARCDGQRWQGAAGGSDTAGFAMVHVHLVCSNLS